MSTTLALLITTIITVVAFHLLDWLFWGTTWAKAHVFAYVPKELFRGAETREGQQRAMLLGMLTTTFAGVVFVPMVFVLGRSFAGARSALLAVLIWGVFLLPGALYNSIYYRIPKQMMWLQAWASLARVLVGLVLVTWLFATFRVW